MEQNATCPQADFASDKNLELAAAEHYLKMRSQRERCYTRRSHGGAKYSIFYFIAKIMGRIVMRVSVGVSVVVLTGLVAWHAAGRLTGEEKQHKNTPAVDVSRFYKGSRFITPADGVDYSAPSGKVWYAIRE
jgi:hypothetical protein